MDTAYRWGIKSNSQLGDGTTNTIYTPKRVLVAAGQVAGIPFAHFGVGSSHICVTASVGGAASCSGWNCYGQLRINSTTERHIQSPVYGSGPVAAQRCRLRQAVSITV